MSHSEQYPISDTTAPADCALHNSLGHQSPHTDPDASPVPSDLNHTAEETGHDESNLEQQLQDLDLNKEEVEEAAETKYDDDGWGKIDDDWNDADAGASGEEVLEEENVNDNGNGGENVKRHEGVRSHFPVRPDAEDCAYYMKTGLCKFGSNCKFNHPVRRKNQAVQERFQQNDESIEKQNQTECKYYLRTGGCKFGKACRYNHTRANSSAGLILELNFLGLPIRQGEKECPYYMRNGSCKYGANCRFNHPDPTVAGACDPPAVFGNGGSVPSQVNMASWSSPRALNETATPSYMPIMFSPTQGVPPTNSEWNGYQSTVYPPPERSLHQPPAYVMSNPSTETTVYAQHQSQMVVDEFPVRPGQPECNYFLKTGDCKFKSNCKYHHPKHRYAKPSQCTLSDKGLPLRPDQSICSHYSRYGICKFGPACKFDHSMQAAPSTTVSELDQPPPFSHYAPLKQTGISGTNGTDTVVQQPV